MVSSRVEQLKKMKDRIDSKKKGQKKAKNMRIEARDNARARKLETRQKVILGGATLKGIKEGYLSPLEAINFIKAAAIRPQDLAAFEEIIDKLEKEMANTT